ncbi:peptidase inhibitor family I36 protein [Streptomyces sp. NBC_01795]|uniref:peptidase inhibitor family I36 protein n=1 Tax=Streptomyces sp. NBC_01795 TaxID=2975943 RepID=UPI002DDC3192|nr:peptidase inhibitor family I36 protein [Streptomyces sp. NBC_01795]WSA94976.1 peptidase inhibitor family I36 protein [Streptomyces sp. NBC_01795]
MTGMPGRGPRTAAGTVATGAVAAVALAMLAALTAHPAGAQQSTAAPQQSHTGARHSTARQAASPRLGKCGSGELCLWQRTGFRGKPRAYELSGIDIESCVRLPAGVTAVSSANRTGRPVTLYQSEECAETAEFATHPSGSWMPQLPYKARAFKVWEH